ncbi:Capsular polysaccharide synthesis protein [Butyrivibrio sp. YAB3001]|nr:Capsular polysaccharide synthesis protein [Butyrivibrio sp. YAB3001]
MWLDATFFCTDSVLLDSYFNEPIWSIKRPEYNHASVACGYFAGYSLECHEENRYAFSTMRDLFLNYWKNNDIMVDYLMVDYMIVLAQKHDKRIQNQFDRISPNNPKCDELIKVLNEQFDKDKWADLKTDTCLFKLSWKQKFIEEKDGKPTFYKYLIEGKL